MGDANASISTPQPQTLAYSWAAHGHLAHRTSVTFLSQASIRAGLPDALNMRRRFLPAFNTREIGKKDMIFNDAMPDIEVDPQTYDVRVDGELISSEPATELPLAQRYFLF